MTKFQGRKVMTNFLIALGTIINLYILWLIIDEYLATDYNRTNSFVPPKAVISPLSLELHTMTEIGKDALEVLPRKSFYRTWVYELILEQLPAKNYPRLKARLMEYVRKNKLQDRFNLTNN